MKRLFRAAEAEGADVRPTLLGVVTLLFHLLFFLLATSSGVRLASIGLRLGSPSDLAPLPHAGLLQRVRVEVDGPAVVVRADVQSTDIAAAATSVEARRWELPAKDGRPDLGGLVRLLDELHAIDRAQTRAEVAPTDSTSTEVLVGVLDAVRGSGAGARFPQVTLVGVGG